MTKILVRRHSTLIVTSTTPSPWRRRDTRGCIRGWVQAVVTGRQRSSTTPTTSGCHSSYSYRQVDSEKRKCIHRFHRCLLDVVTNRTIKTRVLDPNSICLFTLWLFRQHHSTCPTFCTNSPTTTESPIWSRTYRTRNHSMKSEMTNLETFTFIFRLT